MGSAVLTARNLAELFEMESIRCAVCADEASSFRGVSFYPAKAPLSFERKRPGRSYEDFLKQCGVLSPRYLNQEYEAIRKAIERFEPDLIIELGRPAVFAPAKEYSIPVVSVISAPMFRETPVSSSVLNSFNEYQRAHQMEQVLRISDLFRLSRARICFGPESIQPFPSSADVTRLGFSSITPLSDEKKIRLSIVLCESALIGAKMKRMIIETWGKAPYLVHAYMRNARMERRDNIRFSGRFHLSLLNGSEVCIHDGSEAIMLYCIALGIPQIILYDSSCERSWNAAGVRRSQIGLSIPEEELSLARLYETYRSICALDTFAEKTLALREEAIRLGDLGKLTDLLFSLF